MKKYTVLLIIIAAFVIRLVFSFYLVHFQPQRLIQDNYPQYADALFTGTLHTNSFADEDKRLFPAYPIIIALFIPVFNSPVTSGIVFSIFFSMCVLFLARAVFKDTLLLFILACFPPIWIEQSAKVASEPLFVFLSLCAVMFFFKKKAFLSGLFIGIAFTARPIALALLACFLLFLFHKRRLRENIHIVAGFVIGSSWLFVFNDIAFGPHDLLQQFQHQERYGNFRFGLIQIAHDFYRTLDWKEYKTFFSGLFYVVTNIFALGILAKYRNMSDLTRISFYWMLCVLLFIFSISPFKLLDDFGRYALAALPAYGYAYTLFFRKLTKKIITRNKLPAKDEK